jgi:glycosyltransferase involved in cell wall biosynthesis
MRLKLAVLITYYNERELLRDCLESLWRQPERPDEILVYDDASHYPPEPYLPPGCPVRVVRGGANRGPAFGRNALLAACSSDYVHFHDSDDLFASDWCRQVRHALDRTAIDAVFTEISAFTEAGPAGDGALGLDRLRGGKDLVQFCIEGALLVPSGTYRRPAIQRIGGYRTQLWQSEDYDFHIRLAASGIRYAVILDPLVRIRIRAASRSQARAEVWSSALQALRSLASELPAMYLPDVAEAAARAGSQLYRLGVRDEAREAFRLARKLGARHYRNQSMAYRWLARSLGQEMAESIAACYRRTLPDSIRYRLRTMV